jgi:DNA-binding transcriptional LysR family regulator
MIGTQQLLYFLEVAEQQSFRGAARRLHLSQPALSRSIQKLEEQLGVPLFHRDTKKVQLTLYGEALLPRASATLNSLGDAQQVIEELKGIKGGEFSVGYGPVYSDFLAARSIGEFCRRYPKVNIYTEIGRFTELIERLKSGQLDLFIGETSTFIPTERYKIVPLKKRHAVYCCRSDHPIFATGSLTYTRVTEYPLVSCQLPFRLYNSVHIAGDQLHTDRHTSDAICLTPEVYVADEVESGEFRVLDFKHKPISSQGGIVHFAEREPAPAVEKYIEVFRQLDEAL